MAQRRARYRSPSRQRGLMQGVDRSTTSAVEPVSVRVDAQARSLDLDAALGAELGWTDPT
jgi:hypothetical protein